MATRSDQMEQHRQRLKRGILINMILWPMIPFIIVIGVSFSFFSSDLEEATRARMDRILTDHGRMIDSFLMDRKADLELMTRIYGYEDLDAKGAVEDLYKELARRSAAFVDLGLFDDRGNHIRYAGGWALAGRSYAQEEWFQKTLSGGYYISDVFLGYRNVPHFVVAVRRVEQDRTWVLRATIDTLFFDTLVSGVRMGRTGEAYILNHQGLAQTKRRSGDLALLDRDPAFEGFGSRVQGPGILWFPLGDPPYLYAATGLPNKSWILVARQEKQDAYAPLYSAAVICLILTVCGLAALVVMAVFTSERIVRRIEVLDSQKQELGSQLVRAVQLAEIGEMAAGFAHEINNPLQIIKSEYALLKILVEEVFSGIKSACPGQQEIQDSFSGIHEGLDQIHTQVERCNKITSAILKFGRKNDTCQTLLDPQTLIPEILGLVENRARSGGIDLVTRIDRETPGFMGDPSRFQQVMLNLVNNALDAVSKHHGARGQVQIQAGPVRENGEDLVQIQVKDNGCGIPPDHMNKIFTPFFTTKAVGRGTGLGLSVCLGIIESFGGTMGVESRPGCGTGVVLHLPAHIKSEKNQGG